MEFEFFHIFRHFIGNGLKEFQQFIVEFGFHGGSFDDTVLEFGDHCRGTGKEVPEIIGKIHIDAVDQYIFGVVAVGAENEFTEQEIAQRVGAVFIGKHHGIDHVALTLGHFAFVYQDPAVGENFLRQRQIQRHQHDRPDDGVETDDIFPHEVNIGGPVFFKAFIAFGVAESGDVVGESVQPDIDHMLGIVGYGDAPGEGSAADADIFQPLLDEVDHFIATGYGLNEIGMGIDIFQQTIGVVAEFEEVAFFPNDIDGAAAVGADAFGILDLGFGIKGFTGNAVMTFVRAEVNIALGF